MYNQSKCVNYVHVVMGYKPYLTEFVCILIGPMYSKEGV